MMNQSRVIVQVIFIGCIGSVKEKLFADSTPVEEQKLWKPFNYKANRSTK
jgi:hypothetical protein